MTSFEQLSSNQKIRAALYRDVHAISTETCHFLGLEITKPAVEIVAELLYKKLSVYGLDIEAFAKHAKRTTINTEDVKLLVRRCPSLKAQLSALVPAAPISKEKKRKTITAVRQAEAPTPKAKKSDSPFSKQREPDIQITKQRAPETLLSKQREPKPMDSEDVDKEERMIVDEMTGDYFD